jgi:phosphoribosylaminoimidazole-succinocarboxamide synthase
LPKRFSTKNLEVVDEPTPDRPGVGIFEFTDDYSVFHYGKMPDRIPGKGEALCRMAAFNFELLARNGVPTHFRRFIPPNRMEFTLLRIVDQSGAPIPVGEKNYMVPLQVVFRNTLPPGASVFRRLESGTATLEQFGLDHVPSPNERLEPPLVEFTTKLEEIDRFVSDAEARTIAGLTEEQQERIRRLALTIDDVLTAHAREVGLEHADGKVEFGMLEPGEIILVDNAGTPDENRLMLNGFHIGKQVMRDYYLEQGVEADVQRWAAEGRPRSTWPAPEPLPRGFVVRIANMYRSLCELWTGERIWGAPELDAVIEEVQLLRSSAVRW